MRDFQNADLGLEIWDGERVGEVGFEGIDKGFNRRANLEEARHQRGSVR